MSADNHLQISGLTGLESIGVGASSTVYRAMDVRHGRVVAVKILSTQRLDEQGRLAFERELTAMGVLSAHPNIVDLYGSGTTTDHRPYIVMPYYGGGNYAGRVDQAGPLAWDELADFGIKVSSALATAHRRGFIHRDIKPANIFQGDFDRQPILADFGISSFAMPSLEGAPTVEVSTTPLYAAPEVLEGERPSVRSDLYSLGATLFALAEGHPAYTDPSTEVVVHQITSATDGPRPTADMPSELADLVAELMSPDPELRPAHALDVAERVVALQRDHGLDPTPIVTDSSSGPTLEPKAEPAVIKVGHPAAAATTLSSTEPTRTVTSLNRATEPGMEAPRAPRQPRPPLRPPLWVAASLAALAILVAAGYVLLRDEPDVETAADSPATTSASVEPTTSTEASTTQAPPADSPEESGESEDDDEAGLDPASPTRVDVALVPDGFVDVLWYDKEQEELMVVRNTGDTRFEAADTLITDLAAPGWAAVGDVDGDELSDVFWYDESSDAMHVLRNDGNGLSVETGWITDLESPLWASAGDADGDGRTDVLWLSGNGQDGWHMRAYLSTGSSLIDGGIWLADVEQPTWGGFGDVDGDSRPDLVWYRQETTSARVYHNNGEQLVDDGEWVTVLGPPNWASLADLDGDGRMDMAWYEAWNDGGVVAFLSTGLNFSNAGQWVTGISVPGWAGGFELTDDGRADLIWFHHGQGLTPLANGGRSFIWYPPSAEELAAPSWAAAVDLIG